MESKYHVRSNSFPSASHPTTTRIEQELNKIKNWEATSTSTSTSKSIGSGLFFLEDLYICLEDLLNMASAQKVISNHQDEKCMEELLDGSVRVLDICGITRGTLLQIKENVQALHSSLRRRKGESSIETSVAEYSLFTTKMKKNVRKLIKSLKQVESQFGVFPLLHQDNDLAAVVRVVRDVIAMSMSTFQCLLSFLAMPASKSKASKWFGVAKLMNKGVKTCEDNSNELQCVEASLSTLLSEGADVAKMQVARERLEALENAIESLENGMESVFRHLLKTRVYLLNTLTQ